MRHVFRKLSFFIILLAGVVCFSASAPAGDKRNVLSVNGISCFVGFDKNIVNLYDAGGEKICEYRAGGGDCIIFSSCVSDLDADKMDEILMITGRDNREYGEDLVILEPEARAAGNGDEAKRGKAEGAPSLKEIYRYDMAEINPWKVQTCDVDGDGEKEISIGVFKKARFHPVMAKRPFIYSLTDGCLSPKLLGSRLSRPFTDYIFSDINSDGKDELIAIEYLADGRKAVNTYSWKGFGFEGSGESGSYEDILSIKSCGPSPEGAPAVKALVMLEGKPEWITLYYKNGKLIEY